MIKSDTAKVLIYNVGKEKFLNRGGLWGPEAILSDVGMAFTVSGSDTNGYKFTADNMTAEGGGTAYLTYSSDCGSDVNDYYTDQTGTTFTTEAVTSNDKTIGYYLKHTRNNTTYYMRGGEKASSTSTPNTISDDIAINTFTKALTDGSNNDVWLFVPLSEIQYRIKHLDASSMDVVTATFLISDNDFARRDNDIADWKDASGNSLSNSNNEAATPPSTSNTVTYFVGAGVEDSGNGATCGMCTANIHGKGGKIYQERSTPINKGWYEIRCNAFCTTSGAAKLYASVADATTNTLLKTTYSARPIATPTTRPSTYVAAESVVNSSSTASGEAYYPYQSVVRVYVDEANGATQKLTFGVTVDESVADQTTWTCIDNFEVYYIGETGQNVVLGEEQADLTDMNAQKNSETTSTVRIHRSLTANKWNSIMLPFDMTHSDIVDVFGAGTYVAKLRTVENDATDRTDTKVIYFDAVASIDANYPYIIKPTIGEPTAAELNNIKASALNDNDTYTGNVKTELDKYYTIHKTMFQGRTDSHADYERQERDGIGYETYGGAKVQFVGTYVKEAGQIPANAYLLEAGTTDVEGSTGVWKHRTNTSSSRAFRAWLEVLSGDNATLEAEAKELTLCIDGIEDGTTAIEGITASKPAPQHMGVYTLQGRKVADDASQLPALAKGLYIINGTKVAIR